MSRTFADIGPLEILSSFPPYWISKWPHLKNTFSIISRSNAAIDLNSGAKLQKLVRVSLNVQFLNIWAIL